MCGRYNLTKKVEIIEKELSIKIIERELLKKLVNIAPGELAPVLINENPKREFWMNFGLTVSWSNKRTYVFNARSEGNFNRENDPNYNGTKGILQKPMFRKLIRSKRCLVIANSFIEGTTKEKLNKPYIIFRNDFQTFTFGGLWDEWIDKQTGEIIKSFSIITTPAGSICQAISHHRAPLIISSENRGIWLNTQTDINIISNLLKPFYGKDYNAYPIDNKIKNPNNKLVEYLYPIGKTIKRSVIINIKDSIELFGMGKSISRTRRENQ